MNELEEQESMHSWLCPWGKSKVLSNWCLLRPYDAEFRSLHYLRQPFEIPDIEIMFLTLQAKDSDDDDEVAVGVDRDRFMDEFFEQVINPYFLFII